MGLQDTYDTISRGSVSGRDRYGHQASTGFRMKGSFAAQAASVATAIANLMNAAVVEYDAGLKSVAQPPYIALDEAEQSLTAVLVLKFLLDGTTDDFEYVEIPSFDASALLPGQPFANPAQTQIAAIIAGYTAADYVYQGSWVTSRKRKVTKQVVVASLEEPGEGILPADLPAIGGEEP